MTQGSGTQMKIIADPVTRSVYSRAACIYKRFPRGVCFPDGPEDLALLLQEGRAGAGGVTIRAGGSGLAGQSVGEGIVADISCRMNRVLSVDAASNEAVVEPGVVLEKLNAVLQPKGLWFSPDPSSQDFCCLGGMLANNSKGARSVKYGNTLANVNWVEVMLADGTIHRLDGEAKAPEAYNHPALRQTAGLIAANAQAIVSGWPAARANSSGYNLKGCLGENGTVSLLPLFIGSEGTLGLFMKAGLHLRKLPAHRVLTLFGFSNLESAVRAVPQLGPLKPSACELLDQTFLEIIRHGLGDFPLPVDTGVNTLLLVEADGETSDVARASMEDMIKAAGNEGLVQCRRSSSPSEHGAIWAFRKAASPLLNKGRGTLKSVRFIDDGSVPTGAIPAYVEGVTEILQARDIQPVIYGHAGDGNFHVNPFMDLKDPRYFSQVPLIAAETARLLRSLGGSLSGEHGDGRLRTPFLKMIYGPLTDLFRQVKVVLDPEEVLNPGVIAPREPEPMTRGLRFSPRYTHAELPVPLCRSSTKLEIERCHGCGTCRDFCPTSRHGGHELWSSRGRNHFLQALLAGDLDANDARRDTAAQLFESCLGCSLCAVHCPTGVNVSHLAASVREAFPVRRRRVHDILLGELPSMGYKVRGSVGLLLARAGSTRPARALASSLLHLSLPQKTPFPSAPAFDPSKLYRFTGDGAGRVAYFYGCFGNTYDPAGEAILAVSVLTALGVEVVVPPQGCCGISKMARGLRARAAEDVRFTRRMFKPWIQRGYALLASSPSCLLALAVDHPTLLPGEGSEVLSAAAQPLFRYLKNLMIHKRPDLGMVRKRIVYQTPCHARATGSYADDAAVLRMIPGLELLDVTSECCGMAGSHGLETPWRDMTESMAGDLSARIRRSQPDVVVTPCGSCRIQVQNHLPFPVIHPLSILAESLGVLESGLPPEDGSPH